MCHIPAPHRILLMTYSLFVGRADDQTCPESHAADHAEDHLSSCATHPTDIAPEICGQHLSRNTGSPIHGGPFTVHTPICQLCKETLTPSLHNLHSRYWPSLCGPCGTTSSFSPSLFFIFTPISSHLWSWDRPPFAIQQQQRVTNCQLYLKKLLLFKKYCCANGKLNWLYLTSFEHFTFSAKRKSRQ